MVLCKTLALVVTDQGGRQGPGLITRSQHGGRPDSGCCAVFLCTNLSNWGDTGSASARQGFRLCSPSRLVHTRPPSLTVIFPQFPPRDIKTQFSL